jgi:hypothetical protein
MGHGTTKGQVDPSFTARVNDLETKANKMATQFKTQNDYRNWHMPDTTGDPLDVPSLHNPAWDRNSINQLYCVDILAGPGRKGGTVGDLIAMKWQADFMAAEERAFRTRHASLIRCATIAHGRLNGHGTAGKSIFSFLKDAVQAHIDAGAQTNQ